MAGTCSLYLARRATSDGLFPVKLYARIAGTTVRLSTGISVALEDWDQDGRCIRGRSQDVRKKNLILQKQLSEGHRIITDYLLAGATLTPAKFKEEMRQPSSREDFLVFYRVASQQNYERRVIGPATFDVEQRTLRKIEAYTGGRLLYADISRAWLEGFDAWHARTLRDGGVNGQRAREKSLKHISKYLKAARAAGHTFRWPFEGFTWPRYASKPAFLTEEEVRRLWALRESPEAILRAMLARARALAMPEHNIEQYANEAGVKKVQRVITWFLVQCFTGMRYSDLEAVTWAHIEGDHLVFVPIKTQDVSGAEVRLYLTNTLRRLMPPEPPKSPHRPIWPVISNQKYNAYLKEIADLAGIQKRLTSHMGRHTFATMSLSRGVKLHVLQQLMGVTSIDTVMIYVHVSDRMLDTSMQRAYDTFFS